MQENISRLVANIASKSNSDKIFIIGKGPSLDLIDCSALPPGLVINLNDSERICVGHVAILSANWVRHSLLQDGFRCNYYMTGKPLPSSVQHDLLPPIPLELDDDDMDVLRLERKEFFDEPFVLLNAVKLALALVQFRNIPLDLYFLGFDFSTSTGSAALKAGVDRSGALAGERDALIVSQEYKYRQIARYLSGGDRLRLHHVGNRDFSDMSPAVFMRAVCNRRAFLGDSPINLANPDRVLIVAELTNNHLGEAARLVEMVERAKESGADLIKVQKRDVDSFYTSEQLNSYYWSPFGKTLGDYRRGVELNGEKMDLLDATCRRMDIEWFCSVLDYPSFEAIKTYKPRLIKIPSTISNHTAYHKKIAQSYSGAIVVSTGLTEAEYVDYVLRTYSENDLIYLLHCVSAYPTPRDACNIGVVRTYHELSKKNPKIIPGYSSHDLGSQGCMLAVASGARMLEKHVKLGDADWIHFDKVAIDLGTDEFAKFVREVRQAEEIVGSGHKQVLACEHHKYSVRNLS